MWMIDATALSTLGKISHQISLPSGLIHAGSVVREEVRHRPGCASLFERGTTGPPPVTVHDIPVDSLGQDMATLRHLRGNAPQATSHLGEHEAIALLATHPELRDAIFVVQDRHAVALALTELGRGRVVTPYDCWHDLHERGILTDADRERLFTLVEKNDIGLRRPLRYR